MCTCTKVTRFEHADRRCRFNGGTMSKLYPVVAEFAAQARVSKADYDRQYAESVQDPAGFWGRIGQRLDWITPYREVKDVSFDAKDLHIRWYADGTLNLAANCL